MSLTACDDSVTLMPHMSLIHVTLMPPPQSHLSLTRVVSLMPPAHPLGRLHESAGGRGPLGPPSCPGSCPAVHMEGCSTQGSHCGLHQQCRLHALPIPTHVVTPHTMPEGSPAVQGPPHTLHPLTLNPHPPSLSHPNLPSGAPIQEVQVSQTCRGTLCNHCTEPLH
jgi:hypothetical protein